MNVEQPMQRIETFIYNTGTQQSLVGRLMVAFFPLPTFFPTLAVLRNEDYGRAMAILSELQETQFELSREWVCPNCSEPVPDSLVEHGNRKIRVNLELETAPSARSLRLSFRPCPTGVWKTSVLDRVGLRAQAGRFDEILTECSTDRLVQSDETGLSRIQHLATFGR